LTHYTIDYAIFIGLLITPAAIDHAIVFRHSGATRRQALAASAVSLSHYYCWLKSAAEPDAMRHFHG